MGIAEKTNGKFGTNWQHNTVAGKCQEWENALL